MRKLRRNLSAQNFPASAMEMPTCSGCRDSIADLGLPVSKPDQPCAQNQPHLSLTSHIAKSWWRFAADERMGAPNGRRNERLLIEFQPHSTLRGDWRMATLVSDVGIVASDVVRDKSSKGATSWGAIVAGGVAAAAATLVLILVGSGLGLTIISPFSNESVSVETFSTASAIWLVIVQWLSALLGGYIAGRLRTKWVNLHTDEVFFRDTAHGFLAWALATLLVAGLLGSTIAATVGTGVQAVSSVAAGAVKGGTAAAASDDRSGNMTGYFVDTYYARLIWQSRPKGTTAPPPRSPGF